MKKFCGTGVILFLLFIAPVFQNLHANPGDTTVVTVWNLRKLTQYGNYDTTVTFPTGLRYRKIRMHYILGRYACPGNPQYCGSWDYTTQIFSRPANNDSVEIARVITPYASDWLSLNKTHNYIVDVTDYASVLEGTTGMRFKYDGYSWGFNITLKIEFIEGVPAMDASQVKKVYQGYFPYGNNTNPIENYLTSKSFSYTPSTNRIFLKNTISGHGADNVNCAEFCSKFYGLYVDNNYIGQRQLWRNDCGENQVYPQTGTWVYNRGNWCPGAVVWPIYHDLSSITSANTSHSVDINMQSHIGNGNAGYIFETQLVHYSAPNHSVDVSVEDIMAPTKDANYFRQNPRCATPLIRMRNAGTSGVQSIGFSYGLRGATPLTYTWTGNLNFLDTALIPLPASSAMFSNTTAAIFDVSVTAVNGQPGDENLFNNRYSSSVAPNAVFPKSFVIRLLTNNAAGENEWTLFDENDFPIVSNSPLTNTTTHRDTITNLPPGCYRFSIKDYGCNGLSWWAAPSGTGSGNLRFDRVDANATVFHFPFDFGCSFTKYFIVLPDPIPVDTTSVSKNEAELAVIDVFPNPAQGQAIIKIDLSRASNVSYRISEISGKVLSEKTLGHVDGLFETIDLSRYAAGIYLVNVSLGDGSSVTRKLMIE